MAAQARVGPAALLGHDSARDGDEPGVGDHPVEGPHRLALDVPRPIERLERLDQRPVPLAVERLGDLLRLHDRRHVGEEDSARPQHARHERDQLPGLGQIEDDAVDRVFFGEAVFDGPQPDHEVRDLTEPHVDVRQRATRELVALLVGDDAAVGPDRPQERQGQGARARARLEYAAPRVDVGPEEDHRQILGIDDLGAPRHLQDVLGEDRAQRQVAQPHRAAHPAALGLPDDRVVRHPAAVGMEGLRLTQKDQVTLAALIGEQDLLAVLERKPVVHLASWTLGAGRNHVAANASNGVSALIQRAAGNP